MSTQNIQQPTQVSDLLAVLLPPTGLRIWLSTIFEARGDETPEDYRLWLEVVERICSDSPSDIDRFTPEQWQWIERKIFANQPQQAELLPLVGAKVVYP